MSSTPAEPRGVDRVWASSDGLRLVARDYAGADGPARLPLVCLHGLTRNARDFEAVAPWLAASGRRVLAPDMRGRGASQWDPDPSHYNVAIYVRDVIELCAALGIARAVFIGTSMGGLITMALASAAPRLVAAAVLNDVGPELAPEGLARIASYVGRAAPVADWAAAADYARTINAAAFPHYGDEDWATFARRLFRPAAQGEPLRLDYDPAIADAFSAPAPAPAPELWPSFDGLAAGRALLLVRGARSDLLSAATRDAMRTHAPAMRVVEIADVGHAPTLDEPEARAALAGFLAAVDRAALANGAARLSLRQPGCKPPDVDV